MSSSHSNFNVAFDYLNGSILNVNYNELDAICKKALNPKGMRAFINPLQKEFLENHITFQENDYKSNIFIKKSYLFLNSCIFTSLLVTLFLINFNQNIQILV